MKDFFISYTKADQPWAEWIAWKLEEGGYSTVIQAWDFKPGANFVLEMQQAAASADRTIAVLSQKYLESSFTASEWAAAFAQDPQGRKQKLIPIRIAPCELTGILAPINYLDLVGLLEKDAQAALLGAFSAARKKPTSAPDFPGTTTTKAPSEPLTSPVYPGATEATSTPIAEILPSVAEKVDQGQRFSTVQRLQFIQQLNEIVPQQFNMLLFAVKPPAGLIPPMPAPQGDRTSALLTWAEAPGGCGLTVIQEILKTILDSPVGPSHPPTPTAAGHSIPANVLSSSPLSELSDETISSTEEAVLLIHGIRDFVEWQDTVSNALAEIPNTEIYPLKYGRFDAFRFWFPVWTREATVTKLLWRIRGAHDRFPTAKLSVIAHSFGTYAIGKILRENPDIRLHRLILCGAILPSDFRWDQIQHKVETDIINDCGIRDIWPVLAQSTTFGYGPSGRFGFGTPGVRDRFHDFGHRGFFEEKFVRDFWLPWFQKGDFLKSKARPPTGARWHLLAIIQLKWLAILSCAFIAAAYLHNLKHMLEAPSIFRVRVTVADEAGRPVENARIWANVDTVPKKVDSGWELDVPERALPGNGEMIVSAEDNDHTSHGRTTVKLGPEEQVTATLELVPDSVDIRGVVIDEQQNAIVGVRVTVVGFSEEGAETDSNGGFQLKSHVGKNQQARLHFEKTSFRSFEDYYPVGQRPVTVMMHRLAP